jgi:hypothetical protein
MTTPQVLRVFRVRLAERFEVDWLSALQLRDMLGKQALGDVRR